METCWKRRVGSRGKAGRRQRLPRRSFCAWLSQTGADGNGVSLVHTREVPGSIPGTPISARIVAWIPHDYAGQVCHSVAEIRVWCLPPCPTSEIACLGNVKDRGAVFAERAGRAGRRSSPANAAALGSKSSSRYAKFARDLLLKLCEQTHSELSSCLLHLRSRVATLRRLSLDLHVRWHVRHRHRQPISPPTGWRLRD